MKNTNLNVINVKNTIKPYLKSKGQTHRKIQIYDRYRYMPSDCNFFVRWWKCLKYKKNYIEEEINNLKTVPALSCAFLGIIILWEFV